MSESKDFSALANNCCCCIPLRLGTAIIGLITLIVDIVILFKWDIFLYRNHATGLDIAVLVYFALGEIPGDLALIIGSWTENSKLFEGTEKVKYVFSNSYTILLLLYCDRAWNNSDAVWRGVIIYFIYCAIIVSYFKFVTKQYIKLLSEEYPSNGNQVPTNATSGP